MRKQLMIYHHFQTLYHQNIIMTAKQLKEFLHLTFPEQEMEISKIIITI